MHFKNGPMKDFKKWDPADYNGLEVLRMSCGKIWLPDIVLYNR